MVIAFNPFPLSWAVMTAGGVPYIKMYLGGIHPTIDHATSQLPTVKKVLHPSIPTAGLPYMQLLNNASIVR